MVRKTKEEKENTRQLILQAALDCFYEKGFSKTSFDDIAAKIGMTKGAVYWHFKDKSDLLVELIKQEVELLQTQARSAKWGAKLGYIRSLKYAKGGVACPACQAGAAVPTPQDKAYIKPIKKVEEKACGGKAKKAKKRYCGGWL